MNRKLCWCHGVHQAILDAVDRRAPSQVGGARVAAIFISSGESSNVPRHDSDFYN